MNLYESHYYAIHGTCPCEIGGEAVRRAMEVYRPMFAPIFGENVLIEPYETVLSGGGECVLAVRIGREEA